MIIINDYDCYCNQQRKMNPKNYYWSAVGAFNKYVVFCIEDQD